MATTNTQNSPANYSPFLRYKNYSSVAWETTGNTMTINDANVHSNSLILFMHTSARAGSWYVTVSEGSFIITSSDSESATTTTFKYIAL